MTLDKKDFFKEKRLWSLVKDELLGCYLLPYFTKILSTGKPILYVDCFAGKGKFEDGNPGSPLIALDCLQKSLLIHKGKDSKPIVMMKFIERDHAKELVDNLSKHLSDICEVLDGKFEDTIIPLLQKAKSRYPKLNLFLYVDPYGVKVLNTKLFYHLPIAFDTVEILINLNTFGFIREACRVVKDSLPDEKDDIFDDLDEYDSSFSKSKEELNDVAGGDYWQPIINDYLQGKIDCLAAEKGIAQLYKLYLQKHYTYVLDLPIRIKPGQQPKYRMVHATRHPHGCILMANNIDKRSEYLVRDIQNRGQVSIFPITVDSEIIDDYTLTEKVKELLGKYTDYTSLTEFFANFFNEYGVLCGTSRLVDAVLKPFEHKNYIEVKRNPSVTQNKQPTKFWSDDKNKTVHLRKRR